MMFRYVVPGTPKFTVETFAATRFGSYRKRPDHKKQFVAAVKDFVHNSASSSLVASAQSNSATTTNSSGGNGCNYKWRPILGWDNDNIEGAFWKLNLD